MTGGASDNAQNTRTNAFRQIHRTNDINADPAFGIAAANRKYKNCISCVQTTDLQPSLENRFPAFVIGACGQFRDIIGWRIGFNSTKLAKVIHRVAAIPGATADTQHKQTPPPRPQRRKLGDQAID